MNKQHYVAKILSNATYARQQQASAFAPANIALCKYWGKLNHELNTPITSSLSIGLNNYGTSTEIYLDQHQEDTIYFNEQAIDKNSTFFERIQDFLALIRHDNLYFTIKSRSNIPLAAGLASSASGFASLTLALNQLFGWNLNQQALSLLARLGSGSACRSLWQGFVEWHHHSDPFLSFAEPINTTWPTLAIGLLIVSHQEKAISSRAAMNITAATSPFYPVWPTVVNRDLSLIKTGIHQQDIATLGAASEANAIALHALMHTATPCINYDLPATRAAKQRVWELRESKIPVYFTQDAGPNLKLIFLKKNTADIKQAFKNIIVIDPFELSTER